jgi:hypothetical protein
VIAAQVFLAGAAEEQYIAIYLGGVAVVAETAVAVLGVVRGQQNIIGQFEKRFIVAAVRADKAVGDTGCAKSRHKEQRDDSGKSVRQLGISRRLFLFFGKFDALSYSRFTGRGLNLTVE